MASSDQKSIASRQEGEAPATLADKIVIIAGVELSS